MAITALQTSLINPSFKHLSFGQSHLGRFTTGVAITALAVTGIALFSASPVVVIASAVAAVAGIVFLAISARHVLIYDLSLMFTVCTQKRWWNPVSDDVLLGGIPFQHHAELIKTEGVTHVITLLDDFELDRGLINPVTHDQWKAQKIDHLQAKAPDYEGVSITHIDRIVTHMRRVRRKHRRAKFYIHCKAGRGRSATIVLVDRLLQKHRKKKIHLWKGDLEQLISQEIDLLAKIRPQISLNPRQRTAILEYFQHKRAMR